MVSWKQWSEPGEWSNTVTGVGHDKKLYTVERDGRLYETRARSGRSKELDSGYNTKFLVSDGEILVAIEKNGTLYKIDPEAGTWESVGNAGDWKGTIAADAVGGWLYTVEASGKLYRTDLDDGTWEEIGDEYDTRYLWAWGEYVYVLENDGTLYKIDPETSEFERFGDATAYSEVTAATIHGGTLFTVEDGKIGATSIEDGAYEEFPEADYANTRHLFGAGDYLYSIENDGTLYQITV